MSLEFDRNILREEDLATLTRLVGERAPDLIIAPHGAPYLYRWNLTPKDDTIGAQVYFHVQTGSDPDRGLHDHPWDNMSVILAGGYRELLSVNPGGGHYDVEEHERIKGDVIFRKAGHAHRLLMREGQVYTMSLFSAGPVLKEWGFWVPDETRPGKTKWVSSKVVVDQRRENGVSVQQGVRK